MIKLKRVKKEDIPILKSIKERAFRSEFERLGFTPEDMISIKWHEEMLEKSIYYAACNEHNIIGGVNIFQFDEGYYLCSLFIDEELQNRGLGCEVMKQLEKLHDDRNKWQLETPSSSIQNHHFYEKLGYVHIEDITPQYAPKGFSLRLYEKVL